MECVSWQLLCCAPQLIEAHQALLLHQQPAPQTRQEAGVYQGQQLPRQRAVTPHLLLEVCEAEGGGG